MQKRILVTGGSGFLGTHLLRALVEQGHSVKNIDLRESKEFPTIISDVRDAEKMEAEIKDVDLVFHLASLIEAGESVKFPQKFVDYNISGTVSVLEAMRKNNVPTFIFSSSAAIYGEPKTIPITEDDRTLPINPYGMTKLAMEGLISSYVASFGMTGVALRYFNLYGPEEHHEPETHALPRFIEQIYSDQEVTVWGNGGHLRDYIHIRDIVAGHLSAISFSSEHQSKYHYFNLSTEKPASVLDLVSAIEKCLGKKARVVNHPDRPGDPRQLYASAQKAHEQMGWKAEISLEDGIAETVRYFVDLWKKTT